MTIFTFNEVPVGSIIICQGRYLIKIKQPIPGKEPHNQGSNCIMLDNLHRISIGWRTKVKLFVHPDEIDNLEPFELANKVIKKYVHHREE